MNLCFNPSEKFYEDNYFLKRYNQSKYKELTITELNFVNKKSIQDDNLYFTNKFQRKTSERIENIKTVITELTKNHNY